MFSGDSLKTFFLTGSSAFCCKTVGNKVLYKMGQDVDFLAVRNVRYEFLT